MRFIELKRRYRDSKVLVNADNIGVIFGWSGYSEVCVEDYTVEVEETIEEIKRLISGVDG